MISAFASRPLIRQTVILTDRKGKRSLRQTDRQTDTRASADRPRHYGLTETILSGATENEKKQ